MAEYTVYTKSNCSWCVRAKELLASKHVPFVEVEVDVGEDNIAELRRRLPDVKTVPQVFLGDELIGGYDRLVMHLADVYGGSPSDELC